MRALIRVTAWERQSGWRRGLGALVRVGILITFVAILIDLLGPPVGIFITARMEGRRVPAVKVATEALADYSVADTPGTKLSYFGYEFEVPWKARFTEKKIGKTLVHLKFQSGQNVLLIIPANQRGLLTDIVEDQSLKMGDLRLIFGDLTNRSAYDQYGVLLNTTPQSIRAFGPRAEAVRGVTLLTIKAIAVGPGLITGSFSFAFPGKRGFQIGDPEKAGRVDLEVFDDSGHHVEILCRTDGGKGHFSQAEINRIITTLHTSTASADVVAMQDSRVGPD